MDQLRRCQALLQGHFQLSSGLHSAQYFQIALLFEDPLVGRNLTEALAQQVQRGHTPPPQRVVGVAMGGIVVAHEMAAALGIKSCFVERVDGQMALRRGFHIQRGERVLVVEDVITTGKSSAEVAEVVRRAGGEVVAQAALIRRNMGPVQLDVPLFSLLEVDVESWPAEQCPLCKKGIPVTKPGSRPE